MCRCTVSFKNYTKMKLALIFLSIFVAISHQQYYRNPRMMFAFPWLAVHQPAVYNDYNLLHDDIYKVENSRNIFTAEEEGEEFLDTHSRIKGVSRYRPQPSFEDQQNARFLFNLFASTTGAFNNPLLKTATFTLTQTLTLANVVRCAPANNFVPAPAACRRKRSDENDGDIEESHDQFPITPSETLGLVPTVLSSSHGRAFNLLSSSRDDIVNEMSASDLYLRDKRFFINNYRPVETVVSTFVTTYAFVNTTTTVTVNLIPPAAFGAANPPVCLAVGAVVADKPACVTCIPAGFVVCPPATG